MAPQYKLTYFDITGLGESIRMLFNYGGINFVDQRISQADWPALKPSKCCTKMYIKLQTKKTIDL